MQSAKTWVGPNQTSPTYTICKVYQCHALWLIKFIFILSLTSIHLLHSRYSSHFLYLNCSKFYVTEIEPKCILIFCNGHMLSLLIYTLLLVIFIRGVLVKNRHQKHFRNNWDLEERQKGIIGFFFYLLHRDKATLVFFSIQLFMSKKNLSVYYICNNIIFFLFLRSYSYNFRIKVIII